MAEEQSLATTAPQAPLTSEIPLPHDLETTLPKPYLARALIAPDTEHTNGTQGHDHNGMTLLQQHVTFFNQNNDRVVYPWETFIDVVNLGSMSFSLLFWQLISMLFSVFLPNHGGFLPPLPIYISNIHRAKHGSDSGVYDTEGRYVPVNLENIFSKYAKTVPNKLTFKEMWNMTEGNRLNFDFIG